MEHTGNLATESSHDAIAQTQLICGLPDDIALLCLAKVPRTYHANLKCVSKKWKELVCSEELHTFRKKHNLSETWIYALCEDEFDCQRLCCYVLDPYAPKKRWKRLRDLPPRVARRLGMRFEVLGKKAYLIGGHYISKRDLDEEDRGGSKMKAVDEVHCYDITANSWDKGVPLTTPRCYFASEVLNGNIYAFGSTSGCDGGRTWETYEDVTNTWTSHSYPNVISRVTGSTVFNEKIYLRNSNFVGPSGACGAVYEPSTGTWHEADPDLMSGWRDPVVVVGGKLFSFDQRPGFKLRMWREDRKKWVVVAELSSYLWEPPYRVVAIGKSIFFIGKGLATTKLDVSNVGEGGALLISDVAEGFSEGVSIVVLINMERTGSECDDSIKEETAKAPLICGLPDDVCLLCLARVPTNCHVKLECVLKIWRELACGKEWHVIRKKYNLEEIWINVLCRDGYCGENNWPNYLPLC